MLCGVVTYVLAAGALCYVDDTLCSGGWYIMFWSAIPPLVLLLIFSLNN